MNRDYDGRNQITQKGGRRPQGNSSGQQLSPLFEEPGKGEKLRINKYQLWKGIIQPGASKSVHKRIHFIDKTTQRKLNGVYLLKLILNGIEIEQRQFTFQR
jgi:hypothetical protein